MNDMERQIIRARILHQNLLRLGVSRVVCYCGESDPVSFSVEHMFEKADGNDVCGTCSNCIAIQEAAKKGISREEKKVAYLKKEGVRVLRCLCGTDNVFCLQADHVDGKAFGTETYALCRNCHRKRTARQLSEHPGFNGDPNNPLVRLANRVGSVADYLEFAAGHLRKTEEELLNLADRYS